MTSLPDNKVPKEYQKALKSWRTLATELGYTGNIFWKIPAGWTLKEAAKDENAYDHFEYALSLDFEDTPTEESYVFFIPRLLPNSTNKTYAEQKELLEEKGMMMGSVGLLAGLILSHYKETGERIPLNLDYVRTDTRLADRNRLRLGYFDAKGLDCSHWNWGEGPLSDIGVFALGGETLELSDTRSDCASCKQFHEKKHVLSI